MDARKTKSFGIPAVDCRSTLYHSNRQSRMSYVLIKCNNESWMVVFVLLNTIVTQCCVIDKSHSYTKTAPYFYHAVSLLLSLSLNKEGSKVVSLFLPWLVKVDASTDTSFVLFIFSHLFVWLLLYSDNYKGTYSNYCILCITYPLQFKYRYNWFYLLLKIMNMKVLPL